MPARRAITDPLFNLREIVKQMILLEDHLAHPYKLCPDCVRKHLLFIEALAEEATALDPTGRMPLYEWLAELARVWLIQLADLAKRPMDVAGEVRGLRKRLVPFVYDPRESVKEVACRVASVSWARRYSCTHDPSNFGATLHVRRTTGSGTGPRAP